MQIKVAATVLLVVGLFAGGLWTGRKIERTAWLEREVELNAEAADMIRIAAEDAAAAERVQAQQLIDGLSEYHQGLEADRDEKDRIIAGFVAGTHRLSIGAKCPSSGQAAGEGAAGAGGAQAETRAELSQSAGRFLIGEAVRADAYTRQLNAVIGALEACEKVAAAP